MSGINELKRAVKSGVWRQHKFRVTFSFPEAVASVEDVVQASVLARSAKVPDANLGRIEILHEGRKLPLPGDRTFEDFTCTFLQVNDFRIKRAMERWQELFNGSESNTTVNLDSSALVADITFELLDQNDAVVKTYTLQDAWPPVIGGSEGDRASVDSTSEFPVTFAYVNMVSDTSR